MARFRIFAVLLTLLLLGALPGLNAQATPSNTPTIGGCKIFPDNNTWNRDISNDPLDPNSANFINSIGGGTNLHPDFGSDPTYGIPYIVTNGSTMVPVTFNEFGDQSDPGPYPIPLNTPVEAGSDRHILAVNTSNCKLYELYHATAGGSSWTAGSGAIFDLNSNALRPDGWTSADAAGLPILPGLVRYDEVQSGVITHALRFTVSITQHKYIHPATHYASDDTNPNRPPMGLRLRLKASYNLSGFTGNSLVILTALKKYGMIVADNGSNWYISGSNDIRWDDEDLNQMKTVPGSAFEVVQSGTVAPPDKTGIYRNGTFYLRNSNTTGSPNLTVTFGSPGNLPVTGDWDGNGSDTVGVYNTSTGVFSLRNSNTNGAPDYTLVLGNPGDTPLAGRWDSTMVGAGVGVFRPTNGIIYLKKQLTSGFADYYMVLGNPSDVGIAGDWNGNGFASPGVFRPSNTVFYLSNQVTNGVVMSDAALTFGMSGGTPIAGDWTGTGFSGIGVWNNGLFYLKDWVTSGGGANNIFAYGAAGDIPVTGNWNNAPLDQPLLTNPNILVSGSQNQTGAVNPADNGAAD